MTYYERCQKNVEKILNQVIEKWHPDIQEAAVSFDLLFHHPDYDEDTGAPDMSTTLKHQGYEAAGVCRIVNGKDRAKGCRDVEIVIDLMTWKDMTDGERLALVDHEVQHVEVVRDKVTGFIVEDEQSRPKLKIRKHDRQFGWFDVVAQRHGADSAEVRQAIELVATAGQLYLPGFDPNALKSLPFIPRRPRKSGKDVVNEAKGADAVREFVDETRKNLKPGESVTISAGGVSATIKP